MPNHRSVVRETTLRSSVSIRRSTPSIFSSIKLIIATSWPTSAPFPLNHNLLWPK